MTDTAVPEDSVTVAEPSRRAHITPEQEINGWRQLSAVNGVPWVDPMTTPCGTCPWRTKFATTPNPNFPAQAVPAVGRMFLERVWAAPVSGSRLGLLTMCHRGHHASLSEDEWRRRTDVYAPCAAVTAIQQREAIRWHEGEPADVDEAAAVRIARWMGVPERIFLSKQLTKDDLLRRANPAIADESVAHPSLPPMRPGEFAMDAPLPTHDIVCTGSVDDESAREEIEAVAGFTVHQHPEPQHVAVRVEASSREVAVAWLQARLDAP